MSRQKDRLRQPTLIAFYDHAAIVQRLEAMAAQGWMIEEFGTLFWRYRRTQPQRLHMAVQYFPKASAFDPHPTDAQQEMAAFAARDGWQPVAQWDKLQVFANAEEDPIPLETDAVTQVATLRRTLRRGFVPGQLALLLVALYWTGLTVWQFRQDPLTWLSRGSQVYLAPLLLLLYGLISVELCTYGRWLRRAPIAAREQGIVLGLGAHRRFTVFALVATAVLLGVVWASAGGEWPLFVACAAMELGVICLARAAQKRMKRADVPKGLNIAVSVGMVVVLVTVFLIGLVALALRFPLLMGQQGVGQYTTSYGSTFTLYDDPLPLCVEDLTGPIPLPESGARSRQAQRSATVFVARTQYTDRYYGPRTGTGTDRLEYTVTDVKCPALYALCRRAALAEHADRDVGPEELADYWFAIDAGPWQATEAYQLWWSASPLPFYLILWPGRILEIDLDWEPTAEQIACVVQALQP